MQADSTSYTCPRCGMTSHNPQDAEQGYCGNCHDWTGLNMNKASTPLRELECDAVATAKATKEHACRRSPHDIQPQVIAYRGNELVAIIVLQQHIRDEILEVFALAAAGFGADRMALIFETYAAVRDLNKMTREEASINPVTGERWGPGEMQQVALQHNGIEKGWVEESLAVMVANRAGDIGFRTVPFRYSGKHLVWKELPAKLEDAMGEMNVGSGYMVRIMVEAMNSPDADTLFPEFTQETSRDERDLLVTELIMARVPCLVILAGADEERVNFLRKHGRILP